MAPTIKVMLFKGAGFLIPFITCILLSAQVGICSGLEDVKTRDRLLCGIPSSIPGFASSEGEKGWKGFDVDFCRAIAAAVLGDAGKVTFIPVSDEQGFVALQGGEIDVLASASWSMQRDTALGLHFAGASFFGEQGFLAKESFISETAFEVKNLSICMVEDSLGEKYLQQYFQEKNQQESTRETRILSFPDGGQAIKGLEGGRCDLFFGLKAHLAGVSSYIQETSKTRILPDLVAPEVRGPVIRQGDNDWNNVVHWVRFAMLMAEDYGIESANVDQLIQEDDSLITPLFKKNESGISLGLKDDWIYRIISQVGNYGEVFTRNIGEGSGLKLERGPNKLMSQGGVFFAPSFQ